MPSYYEILEVSPKSSPEVIHAAYKALALRYHPDRAEIASRSDVAKFEEVSEAHDILMDPDARAAYDQILWENPSKAPGRLGVAQAPENVSRNSAQEKAPVSKTTHGGARENIEFMGFMLLCVVLAFFAIIVLGMIGGGVIKGWEAFR